MHDALTQFMDWYFENTGVLAAVPHGDPMRVIDGVYGVTLYRDDRFQVELFVVPPNHVIPAHTHPNVDSYEVYMGGSIRFSHSGNFVSEPEQIEAPGTKGLSALRGMKIRVRPNDLHGGVFGPNGAVFISVQSWLNGVKPSSVAYDYDGLVMGPQHLAGVTTGTPFNKSELTALDALGEQLCA